LHHGVILFQTDRAIPPADAARAAEERGFESIFFIEHTHIPVSRKSPFPAGGDLPEQYWRTNDLLVSMGIAAAVTRDIKVGSGVCLVVEHDPIVLAKQVATVDFQSGGRVLFGIGAGWNREEMENHGTDFRTRWKLTRERIAAMKAIWSTDEAEYHGELVHFDKIWQYPKPVQKPNPPILLGGWGPKSYQRVVDFCDGWIPLTWLGHDLIAEMKTLRQVAETSGRDPRSISVTVFGAEDDRARLDAYEKAGVERVLFFLGPATRDEALPLLDRFAKHLH
jgi:probable F420-dependent oxidoreductase